MREIGRLLNNISNRKSDEIKKPAAGILPKGTLFFHHDRHRFAMVFTVAPDLRTIQVYQPDKSKIDVVVDMPELLIIFQAPSTINVLCVIKGMVHIPALRNLGSDDGLLCVGNCPLPVYDERTPIQIRNSVLETIFDGAFSDDMNSFGFSMNEFSEILKKTKDRKVNVTREEFSARCKNLKINYCPLIEKLANSFSNG
jgi:hypothetical protein